MVNDEGHALEETPISTSENSKSNNTDELRKKLLAAFIYGRKLMHFSNNKGFIDNSVFEGVTTSAKHSDRILGRSEVLSFDNEIDFSLSGNVGVGYTPDFANRCRFVRLFLDIEDANSRAFENPNLHLWVLSNRGKILSALFSLVNNWIQKGMIKGSVPFTSFPEWAQICGGIMEAAGYDNPCNSNIDTIALGGDGETKDMKQLFEICYEKFPGIEISKDDIKRLVLEEDSELFSWVNFGDKSSQIRFGLMLNKFIGRVLSDIRLVVVDASVRSARQKFKFIEEKSTWSNKTLGVVAQKSGNDGNVCNDYNPKLILNNKYIGVISIPTIPSLPKEELNMFDEMEMPNG